MKGEALRQAVRASVIDHCLSPSGVREPSGLGCADLRGSRTLHGWEDKAHDPARLDTQITKPMSPAAGGETTEL